MSLNEFKQADGKGRIDQRNGALNKLAVIFKKDSVASADLEVGQFVRWAQDVSDTPVIDEITANTQAVNGFIPLQRRKNTYAKGEVLEVAQDGTIVKVEAGGAIARGAAVEYVLTGVKVQTQASGKRVGYALDVAQADGDLIRITLNFEV